jgi:hypothetical protein
MRPTKHTHAVWGTPVPAVTTTQWGSREWTQFEDLNRPANYRGGRYDKEAWDAYQRTVDMLDVQAFYKDFNLVPPGVLWG